MLRGAVKSHSVEVKQVNALPCALYWLFDVMVLVKASRWLAVADGCSD